MATTTEVKIPDEIWVTSEDIRARLDLIGAYYREAMQNANSSASLLDVIRHRENATHLRGQMEALLWVLEGSK